jgi:hypothetical protein
MLMEEIQHNYKIDKYKIYFIHFLLFSNIINKLVKMGFRYDKNINQRKRKFK